jgi:5'-3' exonuclease
MARKILLAVDLSYQTYRAAAAHPMLTSRRVFTGGLYGFFTTIAKAIRETQATHVVFCEDRKPYLRSLEFSEYKAFRKRSADDELRKMQQQSMKLVRECLGDLGHVGWGLDGFESDDLVAHCVMKYRHRFDMIYAASNDSDLFQLLWAPNFGIYHQDIGGVMTGDKLMKAQGLTPDQFMLMTALTGTHNDLPGIKGVGIVTAKKAIFDPSQMRVLRDKHAEIIDRNLRLIKLPHAQFPPGATLPSYRGGFDERAMYRSLGRYDIDVTLSMVRAFEQIIVNKD